MAEDEIERLHRECLESPGDAGRWVALARCLERLDRAPPPLAPVQLPMLLAAWASAPAERSLARLILPVAMLEPVEARHLVKNPGFWATSRRRILEGDACYDSATGLPLGILRDEDKEFMELLPESLLRIVELPPHEPTLCAVRPGYVQRKLRIEAIRHLPPEEACEVGDPADLRPRFEIHRARIHQACLEEGAPPVPIPPPQDEPLLLSRVFGRLLAHGLGPEDCLPLPEREIFLRGPEDPGMRLAGAMPYTPSAPRSFLDWVKGFFEDD